MSQAGVRHPQRRSQRIALLTPEYPHRATHAGGLASYTQRIARTLIAEGHHAEVFTPGHLSVDQTTTCRGVRVTTVAPRDNRATALLAAHWRLKLAVSATHAQLRAALGMAHALETRHAEAPFDLVQSSDFGLAGYFVARRESRVHAVRCSWSRPEYHRFSGRRTTLDHHAQSLLERRLLRRADVVYAPSAFVANRLSARLGRDVRVIRPPLADAAMAPVRDQPGLPARFFLHAGQLAPIKGTDLLAAALPRVWAQYPDFKMIWAGKECRRGFCNELAEANAWGHFRDNVLYCGPVTRERVAQLIHAAEAVVAPSRFDNLPNSVIEALSLETPVLGTDGASINELVMPGLNGRVADTSTAESLAAALIDAWGNPMSYLPPAANDPVNTLAAMRPSAAAEALIALTPTYRPGGTPLDATPTQQRAA